MDLSISSLETTLQDSTLLPSSHQFGGACSSVLTHIQEKQAIVLSLSQQQFHVLPVDIKISLVMFKMNINWKKHFNMWVSFQAC